MQSEVLFTIVFGSIAAALAIITIVQSYLQHKKRERNTGIQQTIWLSFWHSPTENVPQSNSANRAAEGSEL
ncbi:unnamed protein product [Clonostachys byssicola]|uniref:Uncharacterized protein n=1 Tax=Clonostachys byssicola TaxID=160290 RepID=A0A9N9UKR7_9HYPO|nr:unnamed protein product [Clonostachys byssicola]